MSRKRCHRRVVIPMPPRGLRPKLARDQLLDLGLAHIVNLDIIASGQGTEEVLWQMAGGVLTWSRAADLLGVGQEQMRQQLELVTAVIARWRRTGRVAFSGPEYQAAKLGVQVMDELAEIIDAPTAVDAAEWGEARVNALALQQEQAA
jgi:hypothetical protein